MLSISVMTMSSTATDPSTSVPVMSPRSIIHGDLNLENVLIGPGGMVWLIDFATTREGHPLMDFAHLEAEIIATGDPMPRMHS